MTIAASNQELVYLIRDNESGLHKIGITGNWARRSKELKVGRGSTAVRLVPCVEAKKWERVLHAQFRHKRLPQSEWFRVTEEEALPKMEWLAQELGKAKVGFYVGSWKQAKDGHYYRRRKSSSGHWYTESKSADQIKQAREVYLAERAVTAERVALRQSRQEPGYWPVPDTTEVVWAEKDPALAAEQDRRNLLLTILLGLLLIFATANAAWLVLAIPVAMGLWAGCR